MPEACVRLFELTRSGSHAEAQALQEQLLPLARLLGSTHGVPGVKAALNLIGFDVGYPRAPLMPLAEPAVAAVREILQTPPMARMHVKRMINERYGLIDYETMFWALDESPEPREGMQAFMEKRAPSWVPEQFGRDGGG